MSAIPLAHRGNTSRLRAGLRLALISTPRSGNTWLRHLLGKVFAAHELAVHDPADVDWSNLPRDCIVQMHEHRTPALERKLSDHGFRVVVLARHPLDVLLSVLHFATHDGSTHRWLRGEGGNERSLYGAMPGSAAFLDYAQGKRATALLSVSPQWWDAPACLGLTYEDLVAKPKNVLQSVVDAVGVPPRVPLATAVAATTLANLRAMHRGRHHFWQGQPGHWRRLLVAEVASAIAGAQASVMRRFNYLCDADPHLSRSQADAHWIDLNREELTEKLWHYLATRHELEKARDNLAAARGQLQLLRSAAAGLRQQCAAADRELTAAQARLGPQAELSSARRLLTVGLEDLALAEQSSRDLAAQLALPWQSKLLQVGRAVARALRRVWRAQKKTGLRGDADGPRVHSLVK
jgi:hypothetical protein